MNNYYNNELYHYGVKGMKWGVRKRVQNVTRYGWKQGHAKNVYSRLSTVDKQKSINGKTRGEYMNSRQKQSLSNAKKYWKARAEGKGGYSGRNVIKRFEDSYRSHSLGGRTARAGVSSSFKALQDYGKRKALGIPTSVWNIPVTAATGTASSLAANELINKLFGHF